MSSQLEHLRRALADMDARGVSQDNPFRQGVLAQIARHERTAWRQAHGGWWGEDARFLQMPCAGRASTTPPAKVPKAKGRQR